MSLSILRAFSASLPAIFGFRARPWNGRALTIDERHGALTAYLDEFSRSRSPWYAAQAAHEWLSEHAR